VDALELSKKKNYNHGNRHIESPSFSTASAKLSCPSHFSHHSFQSYNFFSNLFGCNSAPQRKCKARPPGVLRKRSDVEKHSAERREEGMPKKDPLADEMPWRCGEGCTGVNEGAIASLYAVRRLNG
jgi:hypothetical protein